MFFNDARREVVQPSRSDPTPEVAKLEGRQEVELAQIEIALDEQEDALSQPQ